MTDDLDVIYRGDRHQVIACKGAKKTLEKALQRVTPTRKKQRMIKLLEESLRRLADHGAQSISTSNLVQEGELPYGRQFWALKHIPIRVYFWYSKKTEGNLYISHYLYKDRDKLHENDIKKVVNNWRRIEEDG